MVAAGGADPEVRRGIFPAVLPSGEFAGMRKKCLVVLGQTTLRLYTLPAGASDAAKAAEAAEAGGKPSLSLTCDKLLYRRSTERSKRDCIAVVIIKRQKAKLKQLAAFETQASEDVLEIYPTATGSTAAAEVRGWMAALHSPRYLLARGMHLVSHVSGGGQAASQLDVWGRWAVVNRRDGRGEALLHQALRGVVAGEEAERGRLVGWLCDQGAMLFDGADPIDDDDDDGDGKKKKGVLGSLGKSMRKMSLTPRADGSAQPARYGGSAFELLLQLASREGGDAKIDAAWASLLKLIVKQAAAMMSAADLEGALAAARERWATPLADAPATLAALVDSGAALARATAVTLAPPPPPSAAAQNRSLVLLTIARVDCGAAPLAATPDALSLSVTMVHEPAAPGGAPAAAAAFGGGAGGGTRRERHDLDGEACRRLRTDGVAREGGERGGGGPGGRAGGGGVDEGAGPGAS